MAKDPAVLFYTGDFLNGCTDLTFEERGQYITLLCLQHQKGHLSDKTISLCVGSVSVDVLKKFSQDDEGCYFNERMDEEMKKRQQFLDSRYFNGKKGGRPKKPNSKPNYKPNSKPTQNLPEDEDENINRYKDIIEIYNNTSFQKILKLSDNRKKHLIARIKEHGVDKVKEAVINADKSNFLHGHNDHRWKADFDWILKPDNFLKILEGKYNNKKPVMP